MSFLTPDVLTHIAYGAVLLGIWHFSRPVYLAFRKRRTGYGIIFNSVTGIPESLASVRLVTPGQFGQTVSTAVSDKHGRYRLSTKPGEYIVEVKKTGFEFPSRYLKNHSTVYENILPASRIIIRDHGVMTKNIPIDPANTATSAIFRGFHIRLSKTAQVSLAYLSPFVLFLYPSTRRSVVAWGLFTAYLAAIIYRLFTYKPAQPAFGTIKDGETHEAVRQAVVRIFNAKFNKLLETQITGPRGRYAFIVHPGAYYVLIKKPGYRSVRINFPVIKKDGFILARDVTLKRAPEKYVDDIPEPQETAQTQAGYQGF